ncbi:MAG: hypothetical protein CME62_13900 [Halobacteriovoraceae bacterium]|nr:hypothetical protein [Halobacteriovoraceae bacterium]
MKVFLMTLLAFGTMFVMPSNAEAAQCVYELQNGRGRTLQVFRDNARNVRAACRQARRDCVRTARAGYYRARRLNCVQRRVIPNRPNRPGNRFVTRSCTAQLTGPIGVVRLTNFTRRARGRNIRAAHRLACQQAMNQCRRAERRISRRFTSCRITTRSPR